jgi:transposase
MEESMTINVGVDLHKTQFTVYARNGEGMFGKYGTDAEGYKSFLAQLGIWCEQGHQVRLAVESTGNTRYFKRVMEKAGYGVTVINPLKFKVINESVKKTDRHDAATIAEFLEKDMLPEARLCSESSERLRRLLETRKTLVRSMVSIKNQIHGLLVSLGMEDSAASLQSKRGRQKVLDALDKADNGLAVHPLFETIDLLDAQVKKIEKELTALVEKDKTVELLRSIPGCGLITASTIRAYTDDIHRFRTYKQYSSFAGLAPWVQCSNETEHYGSITKRGPEQLRTALVQLVLGMVRMKKTTVSYRLMIRYAALKRQKGSGKSIIATARKLSKVIWFMLMTGKEFDPGLMIDKQIEKKADEMRTSYEKTA